ncbi:MAG: NADH-quinone oxidoreductase subunit A [Firmicutes bacterium]|nr:NADH-quinone oxidoreductase subunit A [Bacillota bacterium]
MRGYAPILILLLVAVALPVVILNLSRLLRPHWPTPTKYSTYECGVVPVTEAREKFSVRYYLVAVMFLVFDVETVFLMPWALQMKELALFGLIEMGIFLFLLLFGYGYIWSKGALTWE